MENKLKGGLADGKTIEDIARKHSVFVGTIKLALEKGIKVESEHTKDNEQAKEIAMDHLWEDSEYYEKLENMEKGKYNSKKIESKESTGADASGSFEAPIFGKTILKKDIHKLHNFKPLDEQMDSSVSAGAMYDGPIGTAGPSSPKDKTKKHRKDPLALDEKSKSGSITAASTKDMIALKPGFPQWGGPDGKRVEIKAKCKKFPYCNQGDQNNIDFLESKDVKDAIQEASSKYGISVKEVKKLVSEALPRGMFDDSNMKAVQGWGVDKRPKKTINIKTKHPIDITTDDDVDVAKLKMICYKYDIDFHESEIK